MMEIVPSARKLHDPTKASRIHLLTAHPDWILHMKIASWLRRIARAISKWHLF